jgi:hypothetical protein
MATLTERLDALQEKAGELRRALESINELGAEELWVSNLLQKDEIISLLSEDHEPPRGILRVDDKLDLESASQVEPE